MVEHDSYTNEELTPAEDEAASHTEQSAEEEHTCYFTYMTGKGEQGDVHI